MRLLKKVSSKCLFYIPHKIFGTSNAWSMLFHLSTINKNAYRLSAITFGRLQQWKIYVCILIPGSDGMHNANCVLENAKIKLNIFLAQPVQTKFNTWSSLYCKLISYRYIFFFLELDLIQFYLSNKFIKYFF